VQISTSLLTARELDKIKRF